MSSEDDEDFYSCPVKKLAKKLLQTEERDDDPPGDSSTKVTENGTIDLLEDSSSNDSLIDVSMPIITRQQRKQMLAAKTSRKRKTRTCNKQIMPTQNSSTTAEPIAILSGDEEEIELEISRKPAPVDMAALNPEVSVLVWWQFREFEKFPIRRFQKLKPIFEFYAKRESMPFERLAFFIDGKVIRPNDTPNGLNMQFADIIEGGYVGEGDKMPDFGDEAQPVKDTCIQFKVQCKDHKRPLFVDIEKTDCLGVLMWKCAEHFEVGVDTLKLCFDGDCLNPADTPASLDLEGGECIDLFFK